MRRISPAIDALSGSVYSRLAERVAARTGPVYPLHIGDTWMEPAVGCRMQDLTVEAHPGMHRYTHVRGLPALIDALVGHDRAFTGLPTRPDEVLVAAGGTGALSSVVGALVDPGDEVIVLAPYWPLIGGMVGVFRGVPVVVPLLGRANSADDAADLLRAAIGPRTVAVYWNTPNNPSGRHIPAAWLRALADVCREHDLWILADEVYASYVYEGVHTPSRPLAPERTVSIHSFSKAYGMAGNRVGWLVGPAAVVAAACKVSTNTFYSTPTASQHAALAALGPAGAAWMDHARVRYAELGRWAADRLGVPAPEGSTFLFVDVAPWLDADGLEGLLLRAVERGLLVAPGTTFGPYPTHVRLCFTSAEPELVRAGVDVLASLIGR